MALALKDTAGANPPLDFKITVDVKTDLKISLKPSGKNQA
jgi:hypothetical protein